jgi:RHS repeat-associated protein
MLRRKLAITLIAPCLLAKAAIAQYGPIGGHNAPLSNASGFGSSLASPTGRFLAEVPLALPSPRGDLPVPLKLMYDGGSQVTDAGVGWTIPFSYVLRSTSLSHRKPAFTAAFVSPAPPERLLANIGGQAFLMNRVQGAYRPLVADTYLRLSGPFQHEQTWNATDLSGRAYTFSHIDGLDDPALWLLTQIADRSGNNTVVLKYRVDTNTTPGGAAAKELLLVEVAYSFNSGPRPSCPKYRIALEYGHPAFWPTDSVAYYLDHGQTRVRTKVLRAITVWSHSSATCSETTSELLRSYEFEYAPDTATHLPRLAGVQLRGRQSDSAAPLTIPSAYYEYGAVTSPDPARRPSAFHDRVLFRSVVPTQLPSDWQMPSGAFGSMGGAGSLGQMVTKQAFIDFTGDGLPDYVTQGGQSSSPFLRIAINRPAPSGSATTLATPKELFTDPLRSTGTFSAQSADVDRYAAQHQINFVSTWVQAIDWNADGRMDILDAQNGREPQQDGTPGARSPRYWRLLINTPDPSSPLGIRWLEREIDMAGIRADLERLGYVFGHQEATPLSRTHSSGRKECRGQRAYFKEHDRWILDEHCVDPLEQIAGSTITEWKLLDANGDGFPDLVFNSRPVLYDTNTKDKGTTCFECSAESERCPFQADDESLIPDHCRGSVSLFEQFELPSSNEIHVYYNNNGGGLSDPGTHREFAAKPQRLYGMGHCGESPRSSPVAVERWREGWTDSWGNPEEEQYLECGFVEVNGDGLPDYIVQRRGSASIPETLGILNNGEPDGFSSKLAITLPGPAATIFNGHFRTCGAQSGVSGNDRYLVSERSAVRDLTGDGLPDYIQGSRVWVGTGGGFTAAKQIVTPEDVPFALSATEEHCNTDPAKAIGPKTIGGLLDIDGDGRLDVVRAVETEDGTTLLMVAKIVGGSKTLGAHDAGQLTRIGNGYGGVTRIEYGSAKRDATTPHRVPFPEIVVTKVEGLMEKELGTPVAPVLYAYGNAQLHYHPLLARWIFPGYGRRVVIRKLPATDGGPSQLPDRQGRTARIYDSFAASDVVPGLVGHALVGRTHDEYLLDGALERSPWALLSLKVDTDNRWHGQLHSAHTITRLSGAPASGSASLECHDSLDPYAGGLAISSSPTLPPDSQQLCRRAVIVSLADTTAWTGTKPPPAAEAVQTRSSVKKIDDYGRPLLIEYQNDTSRSDDDFCLELVYARSLTANPSVLSAAHTVRLVSCQQEHHSTTVYSGMRYSYDHLPEGFVRDGLITNRIVERYEPTSGALLEEYQLDSSSYDRFGNPTLITSQREDGATRSIEIDQFDAFAMLPGRFTVRAFTPDAKAPHEGLVTSYEYDLVSTDILSVTSPSGARVGTTYDSLGRPLRATLTPLPGGPPEYVVREREYLGDLPDDPRGRAVRTRLYHSWTPVGSSILGQTPFASERPITTERTTYFDELGRLRSSEQPLGSGESLVTEQVTYDGFGRTHFLARPFVRPVAGPSTGPERGRQWQPYGITLYYDAAGRVLCGIEGHGIVPFTVLTSELSQVYPTCYEYSFEDHQAVTRVRGASDLLPEVSRASSYSEVRRTAIDQVVSTTRRTSAGSADFIAFSYNPLGYVKQVDRFSKASREGTPTQWSFVWDSLGQLLEVREPTASARKRRYNHWGSIASSSWLDTSRHPAVPRDMWYGYDAFGRLAAVDETVDKVAVPGTAIRYFYGPTSGDPIQRGRLVAAEDATFQTSLEYDPVGHLQSVRRRHRADANTSVETWSYTPNGQLTSLSLALSAHPTLSGRAEYTYDPQRRVRRVTWFDSDSVPSTLFDAIDIDSFGRYRSLRFGNGVGEEYYYRPNGRGELESRVLTFASGRLELSYAHDSIGRVVRTTERFERPTLPDVEVDTIYEYNSLRQLQSVLTMRSTDQGPRVALHEAFTYDTLGNRKTVTDVVGNRILRHIYYPLDPDRLCRIDEEAIPTLADPALRPLPFRPDARQRAVNETRPTLPDTADPSEVGAKRCSYFYDSVGNVASIQDSELSTRVFSYDAASRLKETWQPSHTDALRYDAFGGLAERRAGPTGSTSSVLNVHYGSMIEEWASSLNPDTHVSEVRVPGPDGIVAAIRDLGDASVVLYPHAEISGARWFSSEGGAIVQEVRYRPYGVIAEDTAVSDPDRHSKYLWNFGETFDAAGLTRLGARFYEPAAGRFLQRDPVLNGTSASAANPYAFALNDPANVADPTGLDPCDELNPSCANGPTWVDPSQYEGAPLPPGWGQGRTSVSETPTVAGSSASGFQLPPMSGGRGKVGKSLVDLGVTVSSVLIDQSRDSLLLWLGRADSLGQFDLRTIEALGRLDRFADLQHFMKAWGHVSKVLDIPGLVLGAEKLATPGDLAKAEGLFELGFTLLGWVPGSELTPLIYDLSDMVCGPCTESYATHDSARVGMVTDSAGYLAAEEERLQALEAGLPAPRFDPYAGYSQIVFEDAAGSLRVVHISPVRVVREPVPVHQRRRP